MRYRIGDASITDDADGALLDGIVYFYTDSIIMLFRLYFEDMLPPLQFLRP